MPFFEPRRETTCNHRTKIGRPPTMALGVSSPRATALTILSEVSHVSFCAYGGCSFVIRALFGSERHQSAVPPLVSSAVVAFIAGSGRPSFFFFFFFRREGNAAEEAANVADLRRPAACIQCALKQKGRAITSPPPPSPPSLSVTVPLLWGEALGRGSPRNGEI